MNMIFEWSSVAGIVNNACIFVTIYATSASLKPTDWMIVYGEFDAGGYVDADMETLEEAWEGGKGMNLVMSAGFGRKMDIIAFAYNSPISKRGRQSLRILWSRDYRVRARAHCQATTHKLHKRQITFARVSGLDNPPLIAQQITQAYPASTSSEPREYIILCRERGVRRCG